MGIINILPTEISNKIAAGEVVERPASVIKELVENSIDAGSTVITVEIRKGGITYIRVTDNGKGMEKSDAEVAFLRHATSKIHSENDLDAIYTLGFRGEALSSIGAVAHVDLFTKRAEDKTATHVVCTGGEIKSSSEDAAPNGTTFTVCNLFYNTPARMNFLKKDAGETAAITDIMTRFILSHPEISFRYIVDGKEKYFSPGDGSLVNCVYTVYGKDYAKSVIPVNYETQLLKITGVIGKGETARKNRNYQSFFVNKRYVKSLKLAIAVENAFKNQIMIGKYPMAILNIEINPKHIDINVHPTKLEVKFSQEDEIFRSIYHCVQNALYEIPNVPEITRSEGRPNPISLKSEFVRDSVTNSAQVTLDEPLKNTEKNHINTKKKPEYPDIKDNVHQKATTYTLPQQTPISENIISTSDTTPKPKESQTPTSAYAINKDNEFFIRKQREIVDSYKKISEPLLQDVSEDVSANTKIDLLTKVSDENSSSNVIENFTSDTSQKWGFDRNQLRVIGQVFNTYILAESGDTMIIADQHAAHERLKYEELKKELASKKVTSQMLLVPVVVDLSPTELSVFSENAEKFAELGFEVEEFGNNSLIIRATPEALDEYELKQLVIELIDQFGENRQEVIAEKTERALYTIACKAAVKANHKFDLKQLEALLNAVLDLENINTCPHGRPIIVTMTKKELEKEFKRIV